MQKNGLILGAFALACTGLVVLVNEFTHETISEQQRLELTKTLNQVIPTNMHENRLDEACVPVNSPALLGSKDDLAAYVAYINNTPNAIAIEAIAPDGYNGNIKLIIGVDNQSQILGVRTLAHQETPGLGDKIELRKSDWVLGFNGLAWQAENPLKVKKDGGNIDQFTGATITPRAYLTAVNNALMYITNHRQDIYRSPLVCGEANE